MAISQSDDDSDDQEASESPLSYLLHESHPVQPALPDLPVYIAMLPAELLQRVLTFVDIFSLEAASATCKRWYAIARDNSVWRVVRFFFAKQFCCILRGGILQ